MNKYSSQHNLLLSEVNTIREKNTHLESSLFKREHENRKLSTQVLSLDKSSQAYDGWLHKLQQQLNELELKTHTKQDADH